MSMTLLNSYRRYEKEYARKNLRPATIKQYGDLIYDLANNVGDICVLALNGRVLKKRFREVAKTHPAKANRQKAAASSLCKWLVDEDILESNPCAGLPAYKEKPKERVLTDSELSRFFHALRESGCREETKVCLKLYLLTAARPTEVAAMPVEELDMQKRRWHLPKERSKNNRAHVVPLSKTAYLLLKDTISSENGAIFKSVRVMTPLTSYAINQSLQRILKQADIPQATTHDLRRTAATLINSLGYPSELVARILNHSPKGVTDSVYALYDYESEKLQALESLAEHLISLGL